MKFNHLNVPSHWEHYWTRYPEGYTILEALVSWVSQVDSMVDNVNTWNDYLDDFVSKFDKELQDNVVDILSDWQESGLLDIVINEALQTQMDTLEQETQAKIVSFENKMNEHVYYVSDFGIIGDGVADDTTALQTALTTAFNDNARLELGNYNFRITRPLTILCDLSGSRATITVDGIINDSALVVGYRVDGSSLRKKHIDLPQVINNVRDWTTSVGVEVGNLGESTVIFNYVAEFGVGALFSGYGEGNAYNDFYIKHLHNNKINMKIAPTTDGWVNENNFYCGRFSYSSNMGTDVPGTRNILITGANFPPNNNVFYKPSLEGVTAEYVIDMEYGNHNTFISARFESLNRKVRFGEKSASEFSHSNVILYGFNTYVLIVEETTNAKYNHVYDRDGITMKGSGDGVIKLSAQSGGTNGAINVFAPGDNIHSVVPSKYVVKTSQLGQHFKQSADLFDRIAINTDGRIYFGSGAETPTKYIRSWGADIRTGGGNFEIANGGWNTEHLKLGNHHLWVDATGQLRIKSSAPTSDTDGNIVGSQGGV